MRLFKQTLALIAILIVATMIHVLVTRDTAETAEPEAAPVIEYNMAWPPPPVKPVKTSPEMFVDVNALVSIKDVDMSVVGNGMIQMLILVEGNGGGRAIIPYLLRRDDFVYIDRTPPHLPIVGETWKVASKKINGRGWLYLEYRYVNDGVGAVGAGPPVEPENDEGAGNTIIPDPQVIIK